MNVSSTVCQEGFEALSVLIVDDVHSRDVIAETVEQLGHKTTFADSYQEALQKIPGTRPDIILWDINLSNGKGIELISEIKKSAGGAHIVAMTNDSNPGVERKVRGHGVIYYMHKPSELNELRSIITHLSKRKIRMLPELD